MRFDGENLRQNDFWECFLRDRNSDMSGDQMAEKEEESNRFIVFPHFLKLQSDKLIINLKLRKNIFWWTDR